MTTKQVENPNDIVTFPYVTTTADIQAYVRHYANDDAAIAHFQLGSGLVESFLKWKFPEEFPRAVLALRDSDTVTAYLLARGRQYRLPPHLASYVYFFYGMPHEKIGEPCTLAQWVAYATLNWTVFSRGYTKKIDWTKETGRVNG